MAGIETQTDIPMCVTRTVAWEVVGREEVLCSQAAEDMTYKSITSSEAVSPSTGYKEKSEVSANAGGLSVVTTTLIVIGVLLVCGIGGGIILMQVVKRRRNKLKTPEYSNGYFSRA